MGIQRCDQFAGGWSKLSARNWENPGDQVGEWNVFEVVPIRIACMCTVTEDDSDRMIEYD